MNPSTDPNQLPEPVINALGKAATDAGYRQQLLTDPGQVLGSAASGQQYKFIEPSADKLYLVLPPLKPAAGASAASPAPTTTIEVKDADEAARVIANSAALDPKLRSELVSSPRPFLEKNGLTIPDNVAVVVLEDTATLSNVLLPPVGMDGDQELTDAELETVAGGAACFRVNKCKVTTCFRVSCRVSCSVSCSVNKNF